MEKESKDGLGCIISIVFTVSIILAFLLCACTKEPQVEPDYVKKQYPGITNAEFHFKTGVTTVIEIENWGTGMVREFDRVYKMSSTRSGDDGTIWSRRFIAYFVTDGNQYHYMGWSTVTIHNDVIMWYDGDKICTNLNQDKIIINQP
jgi:hypothetical protein